MRRNIFLILIIISTAIVYFYFGCIYQSRKSENIINDLRIENQSLKEQIENSNVVSENNFIIEEKIHPIDLEEKKCIEKSPVYDYPICLENSEKACDKEIQKNLDLLKKVMSKNEFKHIINMNEQWKKSVNNEIYVINRFIANKDGIINQTTGCSHISNLKKQYSLLLSSIYFTYTES